MSAISLTEVDGLIRELTALRAEMTHLARRSLGSAGGIEVANRDSARNLLHYVALRRHDLRPLQGRLASLGLSSLGRAEAFALGAVDSLLSLLLRLNGNEWHIPEDTPAAPDLQEGHDLLEMHTTALLGPPPPRRRTRIMVTMPSEAADDYTLVHNLLREGMSVMRINCAHDGPPAWSRMIGHLRRAEQTLSIPCRVLMDLGGPKLRTGPLVPGAAVAKVRPRRDVFGRVVAPARLWLTSRELPRDPPTRADAALSVDPAWLGQRLPGDRLYLSDSRGAKRELAIVDCTPEGCWAEARKTLYLVPGLQLQVKHSAVGRDSEDSTTIGDLPCMPGEILLRQGDLLLLTRDDRPGRDATRDAAGEVLTPAHISCTLPEVFSDVKAGESVWLDDGKIGGVIERVEEDRLHVRITRTKANGEKLRSDKGINLPESRLRLPALTPRDLQDLEFVARHADLVGLSFANCSADVESLEKNLDRLGGHQPGIMLKIETRRGFENLPSMLLAAMRTRSVGVMIARGDLAVECGFERLAEVQEEILWICEAAHCPVVWATQVLESLAKDGMASRAEITDAAMGHRAECVMLNKGPHVVRAVQTLDDILRRMEAHQSKKRAMLRELHLAKSFSDG